MGSGTLYGAEHSAMGLGTRLWGWGHWYGAEHTAMGPGTLYGVQCCILVYTGLYWEAPPPPPRCRSQFLFPTPKGEMGGNEGGGGANFGVKSPLFGAFWAPTLGRKAAIWGQKSPIGGKRRSFFGVRTPHLGQKL